METTAKEKLDLIAKDRSEILSFCSQLQEEVINGEHDNLLLMANLNILIKGLTDVKAKAMKEAMNEAEKHGKSFEYFGYKFTIKEAGARYDFTQCGLSAYNNTYKEIKEKENTLKEFEGFLKSLTKATTLVNEENGDIETIYPPAKTSSTIIEVR